MVKILTFLDPKELLLMQVTDPSIFTILERKTEILKHMY